MGVPRRSQYNVEAVELVIRENGGERPSVVEYEETARPERKERPFDQPAADISIASRAEKP